MKRIDLRGVLLPLLLLALAEVLLRWSGINSDSLALPSAVARALVETLADGSLLRATLQTLGCALGGLALGAAAGVVLGALLGVSRRAAVLAWAPVESLRHMPPVALIPIALLALGQGVRMEAAIVAFTCFWPVLLLTQAAVAGVEPRLLDVARVLGLGPAATVRKIVLPAAGPRIAVALRLAAGIALIVAVTTEIAANPLGLGYAMLRAQQELQPARMYACLAWLALLGWTLNAVLARAERRAAVGGGR